MSLFLDEFVVERHPPTRNRSLRAWSAADELLVSHLRSVETPEGQTVVLNDEFGALAVALTDRAPIVVNDSELSLRAIRHTLAANGASAHLDDAPAPLAGVQTTGPATVTVQHSLVPITGAVGTLVVRVPKSGALLEDQLCRVQPHLTPEALVVGGGMVRHIHTSTIQSFETIIGPTRTSLATKKARLIHTEVDSLRATAHSPSPDEFVLDDGTVVVNHANVFARGRLDNGTRLLIDHLPRPSDGAHVVDLGCGSGVLGTILADRFRGGSVRFVDVSHHAVASARATFAANRPDDDRAVFDVADALESLGANEVDLIVTNPPFHDAHVVGDEIVWRMFTGARASLRPGGELWVVANRHLGHHAKMKKLFGSVQTIASDGKFVVLRSVTPAS